MFTAEEWFESQIIEIERMREANYMSEKRLATGQSPTQSSEEVNIQPPNGDFGEKLIQHW